MSYEVFISYSSIDKPIADAVCAHLEANGIRCWIAPRDILPGFEYGAALVAAIEASKIVILVLSQNAAHSPQVLREIERAVNKGVAILPLRIDEVVPSGSLEYFISTTHWLDALTPPLEQHLARLSTVAKVLLQKTPPKEETLHASSGGAREASKELPAVPTLAFEYDSRQGWILKNIGTAPALDIVVAMIIARGGWKEPVRVPPLGPGERFQLAWLGHLNVDSLGATYRDERRNQHSAVCRNDLTKVEAGNVIGEWPEDEIKRHWNARHLRKK